MRRRRRELLLDGEPGQGRAPRRSELEADPSRQNPEHPPADSSRTFYASVLRLRRVRLHWLVRALYLEGAAVLGIVLYLADAASAWVILALPAAIAVAVKVYDLVLDATSSPPEA